MDEKETKKKIRSRRRVGDHFAVVVFCRWHNFDGAKF